MKIIVEEAEIELDLPQREVSLGQVIDEVELSLLEAGKIPVSLSIMDKQLTQEELEARSGDILSGDEILRFGAVSILDYLDEHLKGVAEANDHLLNKIQCFAREVTEGLPPTDVAELMSELNQFFDFWTRLSELLKEDFQDLRFNDRSLSEQLDALQGFFQEMLEGVEAGDLVLAADLLTFEITPVIRTIHEGIPAIKARLKEREAKDRARQTT